MNQLIQDSDYELWLRELKLKIKNSQIKATLSVNSQLILLYWDLGRQIVEKQDKVRWGSGFINQLSKDLKAAFPVLCKNKDDFEGEFSLKDINKPIGDSEYRYSELPERIQKNLPTLEELTDGIKSISKEI